MANKKSNKNKMTPAQREAKMKAAAEREERAKEKKERKERTRKAFVIVITVILIAGLTIPVAALSVLGS